MQGFPAGDKPGSENEALAACDELLRFKPDDPEAQFHCANVLARLDRDGDSRRRS